MTAFDRVEAYLAALQRRLQFLTAWRGLAIGAICALALTLAFTWLANQYRFIEGVVFPLRLLLFAGVVCALLFGLLRPLLKITRGKTVRMAEAHSNDFGERLLTIAERGRADDPFSELIAEDAWNVAAQHPATSFVPSAWIGGFLAAAVVGIAVLLWLIAAAPGYFGYGASLFWTNNGRQSAPLYGIQVTPGNRTVRKLTDQIISAELLGFNSRQVVLHAKYRGSLKWEEMPMQPQVSGSGYQLLFTGLSDSLDYYVKADASESKHFTLTVKELPVVKHLRVTVHAPAALGLPDALQDPGGDIRAVAGSTAEIKIQTDKPLENGTIVLENGTQIPLARSRGEWWTAAVPIKTDGAYHVAALDNKEPVRLTDNYIIEARKDEAPLVKITKPGRDAGVSPIEELPVEVTSSDDFGLRSVDLHYSINGGPEQVRAFTPKNDKEWSSKTTLALEDFKLAPGDLVSFYATAKDASHTSRSDIVFAKVEPFDLKFRQSQQMASGGGGGAGDQGSQISERQKEIIAATWNQIKDPTTEAASLAQNARFLADLEGKLDEQARSLPERMQNRELGSDSPQMKEFSKSMVEASAQMSAAVSELKPGKWAAALPSEQKALQALLHAEALFRDIQVAFGQQSGGGGGGQNGEQRELSRLFDLELDTAKNQYESSQSGGAAPDDRQKQLNEALERLKELARRQQELANEQHNPQQQFKQRWEEEELRREAEQLRQQMQQQGSNGVQQAMNSLAQSEEEMRNAASRGDSAAQQRAANHLQQAQNALKDMLKQQENRNLSDLTERAKQLAASQQNLANRVKQQYGAQGINTLRTGEDGSLQMPEMNGPGYGGFFRRRMQPVPDAPATKEEQSLAEENEKLAGQLEELQKQLQQHAESVAGQQPETAKKVRKALSEAEQAEIAVRMKKNAEWLKQGFGNKTWPIEDGITASTQRLSRQVEEARATAEKEQNAQAGNDAGSLGQALSQVRALRQEMAAGQAGGRDGRQTASDRLQAVGPQIGRDDKQLNNYYDQALGALRRVNSEKGLFDNRLLASAASSLERLELELARRVGQKSGARSGAPENVPDEYRAAVATYFRTLSK